jgi:phage tail protein X
MEEAKDIRELKSLLAGLSPNDGARPFPAGMEEKAADAYSQKIILLKSLSVLLFSLSLFLFLALLFVLTRSYLTTATYDRATKTIAVPDTLQEVPAVTEPAHAASVQAGLASPAVPQLDREEPAFAVTEPARAVESQPVLAPPAVPPLAPEEPAPADISAGQDVRTVMLQEGGGSLYFIAQKHYGKANETIFDLILQANPSIADVRKIDDRQNIVLPPITAESYVQGNARDGYRIHVGTYDTAQWADMYGSRVKHTDKQVVVEPRQFSSQDTWYRLLIGDFNRKEEALQTVSALVKRGLIFLPPSPG